MFVAITLCLVSLCVTMWYSYVINMTQPEPYMDEIFHYPQAVKYFNGVYTEWDPKITTPPGLYISTVIPLKALSDVLQVDLCKLAFFRLTNLIFTIGNFFLLYKILPFGNKKNMEARIFTALIISTFPVLYFFTFLYYTDCGSMFFILLMFLMHQKNCIWAATLSGAAAIVFRQTNIVWIFYVAAERSLLILSQLYKDFKSKSNHKKHSFSRTLFPFLKKRWKIILHKVISVNYGYIILAVLFCMFVSFNGSIALGDKSAHQVSINIPQIFYFLLFTVFFSSSHLFTFEKTKRFLRFVITNKVLVATFILFCSYCITYMTQVHPYLLADNRHLTFYLWKRLLGRNIYVQHMLIPIYLYASWSIFTELSHLPLTSYFLLCLCISLSVVPQKLIEFRYFIIPYIVIRTKLRMQSKGQVILECMTYTYVNYVALHMFLNRPFLWENSPDTQRFMW